VAEDMQRTQREENSSGAVVGNDRFIEVPGVRQLLFPRL